MIRHMIFLSTGDVTCLHATATMLTAAELFAGVLAGTGVPVLAVVQAAAADMVSKAQTMAMTRAR